MPYTSLDDGPPQLNELLTARLTKMTIQNNAKMQRERSMLIPRMRQQSKTDLISAFDSKQTADTQSVAEADKSLAFGIKVLHEMSKWCIPTTERYSHKPFTYLSCPVNF